MYPPVYSFNLFCKGKSKRKNANKTRRNLKFISTTKKIKELSSLSKKARKRKIEVIVLNRQPVNLKAPVHLNKLNSFNKLYSWIFSMHSRLDYNWKSRTEELIICKLATAEKRANASGNIFINNNWRQIMNGKKSVFQILFDATYLSARES